MSAPGTIGGATALQEIARAKVNLTLRVRGRLANGYHALDSVVVFADFGDSVRLNPAPACSVEASGKFAAAIEGENLVARAVEAVREQAPGVRLGHFDIDKRLPVAAGLGGGSADAAAALRLIRRHNPEIAAGIDWGRAAARVGSDVSVCLESRTALVWGTGQHVRPIDGLDRMPAVLVNAGEVVVPDKTRRVFAALSAPALDAEPGAPPPPPSQGGLRAWLLAAGNDLEPAALGLFTGMDAVGRVLRAQPGCFLARMSGAGPTWFGLFDDEPAAEAAARAISAARPSWWTQSCLLG